MSIEYCNTCKMFHPGEECAPQPPKKHWREYNPKKVHVRKNKNSCPTCGKPGFKP